MVVDLTDSIKGTDIRQKVTGSKITRLDMLYTKLERLRSQLDPNRKSRMTVWEGDEFVERLNNGSLKQMKEIIEYYDKTFVLSIALNKSKNEIIVRLESYLKKSADKDEEEKTEAQ